jgi:hypothetical protein
VDFIDHVARSLKLERLVSRAGVNIVGIGLAATIFSLFVFTFENIWFLFTGDAGVFATRGFLYIPLAGLSAIFCLLSSFICRPGLIRVAYAIFSASMASHVFLLFVVIPSEQMKVIAIIRILASLGLVLLYLRFRSEVAACVRSKS